MDSSIEELNARIEALESFVNSLGNASDIPFEVDNAFRERLAESSNFETSSKTAVSVQESINEAGMASHTVMDPPDRMLKAVLEDGTEVAIPAFNLP